MARRVLKNINTKLNLLWRQSNCLNYLSRNCCVMLLYNLTLTKFDNGCTSWYPVLWSVNRLQMALDIPLFRTIKGQKGMPFLGPKIGNMLSSNIKLAATTASFTHHLKKEILIKLQGWGTLLIFIITIITIFYLFI